MRKGDYYHVSLIDDWFRDTLKNHGGSTVYGPADRYGVLEWQGRTTTYYVALSATPIEPFGYAEVDLEVWIGASTDTGYSRTLLGRERQTTEELEKHAGFSLLDRAVAMAIDLDAEASAAGGPELQYYFAARRS